MVKGQMKQLLTGKSHQGGDGRDSHLGMNGYTVLASQPSVPQGPRDHCTGNQNGHINPTLSEKKQKPNQRIIVCFSVFPALQEAGTTTQDILFLNGSESKYFKLCGSDSLCHSRSARWCSSHRQYIKEQLYPCSNKLH